MSESAIRQPHAVLDLPSRRHKAKKIARLLGLADRPGKLRVLEIGAGSGGISHWFAAENNGRFDVHAVDVVDSRLLKEGYFFKLLDDARLPFDTGTFDVVISNHVIEHVGCDEDQSLHLREFLRVLAKDGCGYLAVPNRWMVVEPHYRVPFLSWWPERWRSRWLRMWGGKVDYDCRPLSRRDLEWRLGSAGFAYRQLHEEALRANFEIEHPDSLLWRGLLRNIPSWVHVLCRGLYPTLIYRLSHPDQDQGSP